MVPPLEEEGFRWPTLGLGICAFIEGELVHGPGDLLGEPVRLGRELRGMIYRAYEVFPRDHPRAGRRRFKRVVWSRRKGWSKTEGAAWLAIVEAHPEGPVRCDGWRKDGKLWVPVGAPVWDPYIPMVAVTEEQTEDLAYGAVKAILQHDACRVAADFDAGEDRAQVVRQGASGQIKLTASAPSAREGARTTFEHFDETALFVTDRLKGAHQTMQDNLPKRVEADAWGLETSLSFNPGQGSVAEDAQLEAELTLAAIRRGELEPVGLLYDHLQADERWDLEVEEQLRAAVVEASGDAVGWTDVDELVRLYQKPRARKPEWRRKWINQPRGMLNAWIDGHDWAECAIAKTGVAPVPDDEAEVVLAFWGGTSRSDAGLVGCTADRYLWVIGAWEPPSPMRVTDGEVDATLEAAQERWTVRELVCSRVGGSGWIDEIESWHERWGNVVEMPVSSPARMGPAGDRLYTAVMDREVTHDGHPALSRHVANAVPVRSVHGTHIRAQADGLAISLARAAVLAFERGSVVLGDLLVGSAYFPGDG